MTSFAFILGVLPLALATGAGAAARNSVGTAVAGGMLASTFLSIFFIPVLYVVIRSMAPGRAHRDRTDGGCTQVHSVHLVLALGTCGACLRGERQALKPSGPHALPVPVETVTFDEAIARALEKNPTVAIAATNILRAEGLLQQARAGDVAERGRIDQQHHPRQRPLVRRSDGAAAQPVVVRLVGVDAVLRHAVGARTQAMDQVEIARLSVTDTRRQIAVATASAYLAVITQKRQVEVSLTAIDTARRQLEFNTRRREGGVGSRLNELRSAQILAATQALLEVLRLNVLRAQEALGVLLTANGPVDVDGEPSFEVPGETAEAEWLPNRPDVRLFAAQRAANERIVNDSRKDWWPAASVNFGPQLLTPSGLFQPSRTWALTLQLSQPFFDAGQRRGLRRQREAIFQASTFSLEQLQIDARSEVRNARAAVAARERALASAREAVAAANEVLKITIIAFDAGATTNIEVIDAQRSARDQELVMVQVEDGLRQARLDLLVALGSVPEVVAPVYCCTASNSISNSSVSFGRMMPGGGFAPYANRGGMTTRRSPPTSMPSSATLKPSITPWPTVNEN